MYHLHNQDVIYSTLTQPYTYQPTKNLFAMDGMVGYEQVDPLTLVWSIRPGMKFHNGDPVNSEAVAFSFGRLEKLYRALDGTHTTRTGFAFVDSFEATDELTVTENWARPNADAPVYRARHYYSFLNPRIVEEFGKFEGSYEHADGTIEDVASVQDLPLGSGSGPYILTKRDAEGTRVERWPDYHRHIPAADGFVLDGPYIDAWETRVIPDQIAARSAFLRGELDVFARLDPLEVPDYEGVNHVTVAELPAEDFSAQGMDGGKFHDRRARQALQKAFDYETFIEDLLPVGGRYAAPISNLLPHFQQLSQEDLQEWYRYDPQEARALWAAADFAVPVDKIKILEQAGGPHQRPVSAFVAASLAEALDVETEVETADPYTWATRATDRSGDVKDWDLLSYGVGTSGGTTGLPYDTHLVQYDPSAYGFFAFNHHTGSPHPEIATDAQALTGMLSQQEQETDPDARAELLTDIQRWILDRHWCNWALPVATVSYFGFSSRLRDYGADDWLNRYDLRRESMWLADAAGEEGE